MATARNGDLTLSATCADHGTSGFTNLRVRLTPRGVEFDPHVMGACVVTLPLAAATELAAQLATWL